MKRLALGLVVSLFLLAVVILWLPGPRYSDQDRNEIMSSSSKLHSTGTDELGRDRTVRTAMALVIGLTGAIAASALTTLIAGVVGVVAAFCPPILSSGILLMTDLFLTLPWLFLLMVVRSSLPLTIAPLHSAAITFALLAALGWPACARAVFDGARSLRTSEGMIYGRASGLRTAQLITLHVLPSLRSLLFPQFMICIPAFIVAEANLGTLGLGISEPLPSWGAMLLELDSSALLATSHWIFMPLILLVTVLFLLEFLLFDSSLSLEV